MKRADFNHSIFEALNKCELGDGRAAATMIIQEFNAELDSREELTIPYDEQFFVITDELYDALEEIMCDKIGLYVKTAEAKFITKNAMVELKKKYPAA